MPFTGPGPEAHVYVISVAAELSGLHPQTLRTYERMGLVSPGRTGGGGRRYSHNDIEQLRHIAELTASGIGLEGVKRIIELDSQVHALRERNAELRADLERTRAALRAALARTPEQAPSRVPALRDSSAVTLWGGQRVQRRP